MVSTRKKRQSKRKLPSQLDDCDQHIFVGNTASNKQQKATVSERTGDQEFTVDNLGSDLASKESFVKVRTCERCFNEKIDSKMWNIVDAVENRIQNAILTAIDSIFTSWIQLAIRWKNASSGQDATSVTADAEGGGHRGITALFENASEKNIKLQVFNMNDDSKYEWWLADEVIDMSVSGHILTGNHTFITWWQDKQPTQIKLPNFSKNGF